MRCNEFARLTGLLHDYDGLDTYIDLGESLNLICPYKIWPFAHLLYNVLAFSAFKKNADMCFTKYLTTTKCFKQKHVKILV